MTAAALLAMMLAMPPGGIPFSDPSPLFKNTPLPKQIGRAFKVKCELCADGYVTLDKGVRITLYADERLAIHGFSMGEAPLPRGDFILHRFRTGTAANLFSLTHPVTDHEELARRWYRLIAGAEIRAVDRMFAPRLAAAVVVYEAEPHLLLLGRERELAMFWHTTTLELQRDGLHRREILIIAPGLDFSTLSPASIHLEAMYAHILGGGAVAAVTASFIIPL